jgi:hypothetical protein
MSPGGSQPVAGASRDQTANQRCDASEVERPI